MEYPSFLTNPNPEIYLSDNYCVLDLEITHHDHGHARNPDNRLVYGYLQREGRHGNIHIRDEVELGELEEEIRSADFLVAHNAKFELQWLSRSGIDTSKLLVFDTMVGEYVLSGNRGYALGLDSVSKRYGFGGKDDLGILIRNGVCPSDIPYSLLAQYCQQDVQLTNEVFLHQREMLKNDGLLPVTLMRNLFTPVVADMEMKGMHLDKELVDEVHREYVTEHQEVINELNQITGGINMGSPSQVSVFLYRTLGVPIPTNRRGVPLLGKPNVYKEWPEGMPSTDANTLKRLKPRSTRAQRFIALKLRESVLRKKITAYTNRFVEACNGNGMVHGSLNQTVTRTHRLSSSAPNLQNIDRQLKKVFNARHPDYSIGNADYVQLEFRTAGLLGRDAQAMADVEAGVDVHSRTASILFGGRFDSLPDGAERKELRNQAKADTFKPLYGGTKGSPEQEKYYRWFREQYPHIDATQKGWCDEVLEHGRLRTITGLLVYWEGVHYNDKGMLIDGRGKWIEGTIVNLPVQMFATADIATIGVTHLWHMFKLRGLRSFLTNEVHDSALMEVHKDEREEVTELCNKCMVDDMAVFFKNLLGIDVNWIPMEVEVEITTNWGLNK